MFYTLYAVSFICCMIMNFVTSQTVDDFIIGIFVSVIPVINAFIVCSGIVVFLVGKSGYVPNQKLPWRK